MKTLHITFASGNVHTVPVETVRDGLEMAIATIKHTAAGDTITAVTVE